MNFGRDYTAAARELSIEAITEKPGKKADFFSGKIPDGQGGFLWRVRVLNG